MPPYFPNRIWAPAKSSKASLNSSAVINEDDIENRFRHQSSIDGLLRLAEENSQHSPHLIMS